MIFLRKIAINGFSVEESHIQLILRPRGAEATAAVTIEELASGEWKVVGASGNYAQFARGKKRPYFEQYINQWAVASVLEAGTQT